MKKHNRVYKTEVLVPTPDDWYPTDNGHARAFVSILPEVKVPTVRIAVWGDDDFGLEKDTEVETMADAVTLFRKLSREIIEWESVTIKELLDKGFNYA